VGHDEPFDQLFRRGALALTAKIGIEPAIHHEPLHGANHEPFELVLCRALRSVAL